MMRVFKKAIRELFPNKTKSFDSSTGYWQRRYFFGGNSGKGSYGEEAKFKAEKLNNLIGRFNFDGIIELGCGDGNNAAYYKPKYYFGFDISSDAIQICERKFKNKNNFHFFEINEKFKEQIKDIKNTYKVANELAISFDVMFHLVEYEIYEDYLHKLEISSDKFLLIYATDYDKIEQSPHVKHRNYSVDLKEKGWVEYSEFTEYWSDKSIKLFQKQANSLPPILTN